MKIALTASNNTDLNAKVDLRFGRAPYFAIVDLDNNKVRFIENSAQQNASGAGIQAAQTIVDQEIKELITGNVGPKAFKVLNQTKIKVYTTQQDTIKEIITKYKNNSLEEINAPTNNGHAGS